MERMNSNEWVAWCAHTRRAARRVAPERAPCALGDLALAPFQRRAVDRLVQIATRHRGALLADAVGLGKTRVSLAAAAILARGAEVVVCAPARLRHAWELAARSAQMEVSIVSHSAMSRGANAPLEPGSVVLVDEAHAFRNPKAARSRALARWCADHTVLLVTATPVCTHPRDLERLLGLFLAPHALRDVCGLDLDALFERGGASLLRALDEVVVRRESAPHTGGFGRRPAVSLELLGYDAPSPERWLWRHLGDVAATLTLEAWDGAWPRQLFVEHVLRRWEAGPRALLATLDGLAAFHERWLDAHDQGRSLDARTFRDLFGARGEQGVLAFLVPQREAPATSESRARVASDLRTLEELVERARWATTTGRLDAIATAIGARPEDTRWLVFTSAPDAARELYDGLRSRLGAARAIGLVTGTESTCTGLGQTPADELLTRFSPRSHGLDALPHERSLSVLVCTDCVSLGVNLQDCGRVVLADLPYTPLGVEQRVGRLVRPGGPHRTVRVYIPRPRDWQDSLGLRRRLDERLHHARASGAPYVAARALESEPGTGESALAVLDALDALGDTSTTQPEAPTSWLVARGAGRRALLLFYALEYEGHTHHDWLLVREDGRCEEDPMRLLRDLVVFSDARVELTPGEPSMRLLEAGTRRAVELTEELAGARLAPTRAGDGARALWSHLIELSPPIGWLDTARARILRAHPRGVDDALAALTRHDDPEVILERVRELVPSGTSHTAPALRWCAGVMLTR